MFRKLYWVTEYVSEQGHSNVSGVYTSIPELIKHGISPLSEGRLRLSLTKLDHAGEPLGTWLSPEFEGLEAALQPYIRTEEFTADQCDALLRAVRLTKREVAA